MKAVGIKALKNKLSEYLRLVREGEVVLVMDRDEVVAEISRPRSVTMGRTSVWESFLDEEARRGHITRSRRREVSALESLRRAPLPPAPADLLAILQEMRDEAP